MLKAITVYQPFAHFLATGTKPVENRSWATKHRGLVAIHAGKALYQEDIDFCSKMTRQPFDVDDLAYGAVVGVAEIVDVVERHRSRWFVGPRAFVLANARLIQPVPCSGQQRLWNLPVEVERLVRARL